MALRLMLARPSVRLREGSLNRHARGTVVRQVLPPALEDKRFRSRHMLENWKAVVLPIRMRSTPWRRAQCD